MACFLARGVDHIDVSPVFASMLLHCEAARHAGLLRVAVVHLMACVCVCVCVLVCVIVCERERERKHARVYVHACVCVFLLCTSVLRARVTQIFFVARVDLVVWVRNACVHAWVRGCVRLCACV